MNVKQRAADKPPTAAARAATGRARAPECERRSASIFTAVVVAVAYAVDGQGGGAEVEGGEKPVVRRAAAQGGRQFGQQDRLHACRLRRQVDVLVLAREEDGEEERCQRCARGAACCAERGARVA